MNTESDLPVLLLVEADSSTAELYQRVLSTEWNVIVPAGENEAQLAVRRANIHAAVIEPAGLGAWGWQLALRLIEQQVPVIVCSTLDERRKGLELGVRRYLIKPVLASALTQTVREVLSQRE